MSNQDYIRETELTVIGSLITWYDELQSAIGGISPDDFTLKATQDMFKAISNHAATIGGTLDFAVLMNELPDKTLFSAVKEAIAYPVSSVFFNGHLRTLKEQSFNRRVKSALVGMTGQATVNLDDLQNLIDSERNGAYIRSYADKANAGMQAFLDNLGKMKPRVFTGFKFLDETIGGLRIPSVMMLGAYPSVGKTAFALNVAAKQDEPVAIFSLEMSTEMIYERLAASDRKIDYGLFSAQQYTQAQTQAIKESITGFRGRGLYVFDDIYDIEGQSAAIASIKPKLVIVDYLQKVRTSKKTDGRRSEIDYISGMYKQIAMHNKCAIILLSQISRIDKNQPTMSSLKESGSLEADGDYVGILHRPYVLCKNDPSIKPEEAYILVDKNKFGKTGKKELHFNVQYQQFYEVEKPSQKARSKSEPSYAQGALCTGVTPISDDDDCPFL